MKAVILGATFLIVRKIYVYANIFEVFNEWFDDNIPQSI